MLLRLLRPSSRINASAMGPFQLGGIGASDESAYGRQPKPIMWTASVDNILREPNSRRSILETALGTLLSNPGKSFPLLLQSGRDYYLSVPFAAARFSLTPLFSDNYGTFLRAQPGNGAGTVWQADCGLH
jgi:hypothetical protein